MTMRLPNRGAYLISLNNEPAAVLSYDLDAREAYLLKIKDIPLDGAEEFVVLVRSGVLPDTPSEQTIILETWAHYGLESGPMEAVTKHLWAQLEKRGHAFTLEFE